MKIYSPSQVEQWFRCPTAWLLNRKGWRLRTLGKPDKAACLGTGIHDGIFAHYRGEKECEAIAKAAVEKEIAERERFQHWLPGEAIAASPLLAAKTVGKYIAKDPLPKGYKVIDVDLTIPNSGWSKLDLGVESPYDQLEVWDLKTKQTLNAQYLNKTLDEYRYSWQMSHYVHFYGQHKRRPVRQFAIVLIVCEPFKVIVDPVPVDEELQQKWFNDAQAVWSTMEQMENGDLPAWQSPSHYNNFGRCPYWEACNTCRLHEDLFEDHYVNVKEKR